MRLRVIATLLWLVASGCTTALVVQGDVLRPARVPLRAFPRIVVVSEDADPSARLARQLAEHLDSGASEVRTSSDDEVEALRARGALTVGTVIVRVEAALTREDRAAWAQRDQLDCGPLGCVQVRRDVVEDVPVVRGRVRISVLDGPSGRSLQEESIDIEEMGPDEMGMRLRVSERLGQRMTALVDQRSEQVRVALDPVELPDARRALRAIRGGAWARGVALLQGLVDAADFQARPADVRARVLYDLGQALRFDESLPHDVRFERAREALRRAVRLRPERRYARAIRELDEDRQSRRQVREQEEARTHNFRLAGETPTEPVPEPPDSYR